MVGKIQQGSWQLELLISGLALYGVYNGIDKVEEYSSFIGLNIDGPLTGFVFIFSYGLVYIGWRIFFINLLIHVILRGLWIASIGLRYVSNEIEFDELNYAPSYTEYLKKKIGSYDEFIEKLEKLCSIIFAFTFLMFLLLVSLAIFLFVGLAPIAIIEESFDNSVLAIITIIFVLIYMVLGAIVAIDFISLGAIKKIREPWVVKFFSPIFKFYSYLTLSFMYRPILYNFLDQRYTRRFFILLIPYVFILGSFDNLFSNHTNPYQDSESTLLEEGLIILDHSYADLLTERVSDMSDYERTRYLNKNMGSIMLYNYKIENGELEFFVKITKGFTAMMKNKFDIAPIYKPGIRFNLFTEHKEENPDIKSIEKQYLEKYSALRKDYNKERNIFKERADTSGYYKIMKTKRASINEAIDSLEVLKTKEIKNFKKSNNEMIFKKLVSTIQVNIDSVDYSGSLSCKYFKDKFQGSDGILCNLFDAKLPKGNKVVEIIRQRYNTFDSDTISFSTIRIPVYIE